MLYEVITFGLEGAFVGVLVSSVFISTLYYPNIWLLIAFAVALRKVVVRASGDGVAQH